MGWFNEQIKERIKNDDDMFANAFARMANIVSDNGLSTAWDSDRKCADAAVDDILKFYHIKSPELPDNIRELNDVLEYLFRPSGIMRRTVRLEGKWYKDAAGAMLGTTVNGKVVALIPGKLHSYTYIEPETKKRVTINHSTISNLSDEAICFYKPFELRKISIRDLLKYTFGLLTVRDKLLTTAATVTVTLLGMVVPMISKYLYGEVIGYGSLKLLFAAIVTLLSVNIANVLINSVKSIINVNIQTKLNLSVESATMMRILSLPPDFFKKYSSGELAQRVSGVNRLCNMMFNAIFSVGLTAIFSMIYIGQIFSYAPALVVPSLLMTLLTLIFSVVVSFMQTGISRKQMKEEGKESGLVYALINGVAKIKNSGAEKRAFAKWAGQYVKAANYRYNPPMLIKINSVITTAITLSGTMVMYYYALKSNIAPDDYMAFNSAYGMVNAAFAALAGVAVTVAQIKPILEMIKPLLDTVPEVSQDKKVVTRLSGGIEINNISFRYCDSMPFVLDNLSLKIRPGQYVAIVGKTGCGKSTLMRLLLGFEKPSKGAVYYDGKDLSAVDLKSLRRNIGVVMQNGKLFQGDIYSNITISAPWLTLDEAWEAAEMSGMAEDIRNMPMGMNTLISEGQGGISGGQRQRLMIARAIAPKPKILMFDEATSALDNVTQKTVSESLDKLKCTRIVIAHRLSTIRHCDRIIVLDKGQIIEDGTYEELIDNNGFFADLVERQRVN